MVEEHKVSGSFEDQKLKNKAREVIRKDRSLREAAGRKRVSIVFLNKEIYDYFQDLADLTDDVEKGGFIFGDSEMNVEFEAQGGVQFAGVYYVSDYMQCRNVSQDMEFVYEPKESCKEEVYQKSKFSGMIHTHPNDSTPSINDLQLLAVRRAYGAESPIPYILVTGGDRKYIIAYSNPAFYIKVNVMNSPVSMTLDQTLKELCEKEAGPFTWKRYKETSEDVQREYEIVLGDVESSI